MNQRNKQPMNGKNNQPKQQYRSEDVGGLIGKASQTIGTSPQQLKQQIDNGKLDDIVRKLPPQQAKSFQEIISDPEKAKKLMDTPKAKLLMKKLFNSK